MDCHCKDHLHGDWHHDKDCDCANHDFPTHSFVVTRVMEEDPGSGTVFISPSFMEKLYVEDGDPVEIVDAGGIIVQARPHPNPWADARMISLDHKTMEKIGGSRIRIRGLIAVEIVGVLGAGVLAASFLTTLTGWFATAVTRALIALS